MTLESTINKNRYIGNGRTKKFNFSFKAWKTDQVRVYTGDGTTERQYTKCTVTLSASGGYVTFPTAPASGTVVVIRRGMPYIQEDDYRNGTRFDAEEVEDRFDMDCAERQDLKLDLDRSVKIPLTSSKTPDQWWADFQTLSDELLGAKDQIWSWLQAIGTDAVGTQTPVLAEGTTALRTLGERFGDILNVKDFGAVGDGVTDDTLSIQAALDAGAQQNKRVFFPRAPYIISDTLHFWSDGGAPDYDLGGAVFKWAGDLNGTMAVLEPAPASLGAVTVTGALPHMHNGFFDGSLQYTLSSSLDTARHNVYIYKKRTITGITISEGAGVGLAVRCGYAAVTEMHLRDCIFSQLQIGDADVMWNGSDRVFSNEVAGVNYVANCTCVNNLHCDADFSFPVTIDNGLPGDRHIAVTVNSVDPKYIFYKRDNARHFAFCGVSIFSPDNRIVNVYTIRSAANFLVKSTGNMFVNCHTCSQVFGMNFSDYAKPSEMPDSYGWLFDYYKPETSGFTWIQNSYVDGPKYCIYTTVETPKTTYFSGCSWTGSTSQTRNDAFYQTYLAGGKSQPVYADGTRINVRQYCRHIAPDVNIPLSLIAADFFDLRFTKQWIPTKLYKSGREPYDAINRVSGNQSVCVVRQGDRIASGDYYCIGCFVMPNVGVIGRFSWANVYLHSPTSGDAKVVVAKNAAGTALTVAKTDIYRSTSSYSFAVGALQTVEFEGVTSVVIPIYVKALASISNAAIFASVETGPYVSAYLAGDAMLPHLKAGTVSDMKAMSDNISTNTLINLNDPDQGSSVNGQYYCKEISHGTPVWGKMKASVVADTLSALRAMTSSTVDVDDLAVVKSDGSKYVCTAATASGSTWIETAQTIVFSSASAMQAAASYMPERSGVYLMTGTAEVPAGAYRLHDGAWGRFRAFQTIDSYDTFQALKGLDAGEVVRVGSGSSAKAYEYAFMDYERIPATYCVASISARNALSAAEGETCYVRYVSQLSGGATYVRENGAWELLYAVPAVENGHVVDDLGERDLLTGDDIAVGDIVYVEDTGGQMAFAHGESTAWICTHTEWNRVYGTFSSYSDSYMLEQSLSS